MSEYVERQQWHAAHMAELVELERKRPFMLLRPRMFPDGDQWCALYGDNIQEGVCGFGDTPAKAATAFDLAWLNDRARVLPCGCIVCTCAGTQCLGCGARYCDVHKRP